MEVEKAETFLYGRPVKGGLFCPEVFPTPDATATIRLAAPIRGIETLTVVPPRERPLVPWPATDRWRAKLPPEMGADNRAYASIIHRNARLRRLLELGAPEILIEECTTELAAAIDRLERVLRSPDRGVLPPTEWSAIESPPDGERIDTTHLAAPPEAEEPVDACAWIDESRLLVQREGAVFVLDVRSGARTAPLAPTGARLVGVTNGHALFVDPMASRWYSPEESALRGLAVLDVERRQWLRRVPDSTSMVTVEKEQPEDAWLQNNRTGQTAAVGPTGDRPHEVARTPDMRFLWVGSSNGDGLVYDVETAQPWLDLASFELYRQSGAPAIGAADEPFDFWAAAIARTDVWFVVGRDGDVVRDGQILFRIGWPANAAAFDANATRIALVGETIRIVTLASREFYEP